MKNKEHINNMALTAVMTAMLCVTAPLSLPVGPVPISLATFVIYLLVFLLGTKKALLSLFCYMLIGALGLPVFSGASGGIGKLLGPTGGYIIGYFFLAGFAGIISEKLEYRRAALVIGALGGTALLYFFGTLWLGISLGLSPQAAVVQGVLLFIPGDILKIAAAVIIAPEIRKKLCKLQT